MTGPTPPPDPPGRPEGEPCGDLDGDLEGESGETRAATWGLGDVAAGVVAGFVVSVVLQGAVEALWPRGHGPGGLLLPPDSLENLVSTAANLVGLWVGIAGAAVYASRAKGTGSLARDFGLTVRLLDVPLGLAAGVVGQLVLVPLVYLPWEAADPGLRHRLSRPAHQLVGGFHGAELEVIGILVVVGAPVVEEIFFRGILLRALDNRLEPAFGKRIGVVLAVLASALAFALVHFEPVQFLGLAVLGVVLALLARWTGRIGASIFAHAAFNAVTVIGLALGN